MLWILRWHTIERLFCLASAGLERLVVFYSVCRAWPNETRPRGAPPPPPPPTPHDRRRRNRCCCCCWCCCAAAVVRRLLCCGCGWCLRIFLKKILTNGLLCCCGDDREMIEPGRAAVPQLIWRGHRHRLVCPRLRHCCCCNCWGWGCATAASVLLLRCCCLSDGVVLGLPLSVSLGATAPCLNWKFDVAYPLAACDMNAAYAFVTICSPQTQPRACRSESGLFLVIAWWQKY